MNETIKASVDYDFIPGSQDPDKSPTHAMRNRDQGVDQAFQDMNTFVDSQLQKCTAEGLGYAMHAVQDSFARSHAAYQEYRGLFRLSMIGHGINDITPTFEEQLGAAYASQALIERFIQMCPCACSQ